MRTGSGLQNLTDRAVDRAVGGGARTISQPADGDTRILWTTPALTRAATVHPAITSAVPGQRRPEPGAAMHPAGPGRRR